MEKRLEDLLIQKCIAGDKEAFNKLIQFYRKRLYSFLIRLCSDKDIADDLFQEVLIKVWLGLKQYKNQQKFASWLFTIAHNVTVDYQRKKKMKTTDLFEVDIKSNENVLTNIESKETNKIVYNILNNISEKQRKVFLLRQHSGLSFKEIAEITNEPLNTVISHMHYAVKRIRKSLKDNYEITR